MVERYATQSSVTIAGKKATLYLEPEMWAALKVACKYKKMSRNTLLTLIAEKKDDNHNMCSAVRVFLVLFYRNMALRNVDNMINKLEGVLNDG